MSRGGKSTNGQSPDAIPADDPGDLPRWLKFRHGAKRHALPGQRRGKVGIANVVEAPPLIGIKPKQDVHLAVALPKSCYGGAGERTRELLRDTRIRQPEAIRLLRANVHAHHPGVVVVIVANVGRDWYLAQDPLHLVSEFLQDSDIVAGNTNFDRRLNLRALLQFL